MAFERPITIIEALENIQRRKYSLPAIQREFVWDDEDITKLFDSLLRGYPIGAFLFWDVSSKNVQEYQWYDFVVDYHQRDRPRCPVREISDTHVGLTAVLDGQQRLTALNIGLLGSYAKKLPNRRWSSSWAFPKRFLFLNISSYLTNDESGMKYDFRFLTEEHVNNDGGERKWFKVSRIRDMEDLKVVVNYLRSLGLMGENDPAFDILSQLHNAVHKDSPISYYLERDQDLDKVLNIFIRTNESGEKLSHSDLLLSIATAKWSGNAREEIYGLVEELNQIGGGFSFSKDFVLRAGLMLANIGSVGFRVTNFTATNMDKLENEWPAISQALRITVELVSKFGFSSKTLGSENSLLPIAYYIHHRKLDYHFVNSRPYSKDRDLISNWLVKSLVKRGVWGSGVDTLLTQLRESIQQHGNSIFPASELSVVMARLGKELTFTYGELEDMADSEFGPRAFAILTLLYPEVDVSKYVFHVDHVTPKSKAVPKSLDRQGINPEDRSKIRECINRLANLQLIEGHENMSKNDMFPREWLETRFKSEEERAYHVRLHDLGTVPENIHGFIDFYEARRERMLSKLRGILGVRSGVVTESEED